MPIPTPSQSASSMPFDRFIRIYSRIFTQTGRASATGQPPSVQCDVRGWVSALARRRLYGGMMPSIALIVLNSLRHRTRSWWTHSRRAKSRKARSSTRSLTTASPTPRRSHDRCRRAACRRRLVADLHASRAPNPGTSKHSLPFNDLSQSHVHLTRFVVTYLMRSRRSDVAPSVTGGSNSSSSGGKRDRAKALITLEDQRMYMPEHYRMQAEGV